GRFPQLLRPDVEDAGIGRRQDDRERPLEALGDVRRRVTHGIVGMRIDRALLTGLLIAPGDQASVAAGEKDVGIPGVVRDVTAFPAADRVEDLIRAAARATWSALRRLARHA